MSDCKQKQRHPNKYAALRESNKLDGYTRVYRCDDHWHITSEPHYTDRTWHENGYGE